MQGGAGGRRPLTTKNPVSYQRTTANYEDSDLDGHSIDKVPKASRSLLAAAGMSSMPPILNSMQADKA
jgi:hypothetical protein